MIRKSLLVIVIVLFLGAGAFAAIPDELNHINFTNETGDTIVYLFLSPSDSGYWGPDILGSERTLGDGETLGFYLHYPDSCNEFDIMGYNWNDQAFILWNYEICDGYNEDVVITRDDLTDTPPENEYVTVEITNTTSYDMYYIFLSPSDSAAWGADLLDENTILYPNESLSVLVPATPSGFNYDFLAVDEDQDEYKFSVTISDTDITAPIEMRHLQ